MKTSFALLFPLFMLGSAHAVNLNWQTGSYGSNKLVIASVPTTAETFEDRYALYLLQLGHEEEWTYSARLGFSPFAIVDEARHHSGPGTEGIISGTLVLPDDSSYSGLQYLMVLHEIALDKFFFISESPGGASIDLFTLDEIDDDFPNFSQSYLPVSSTGFFYQGAEIPPFCVWLAKHGLVQADLDGLATNLVNQAFAVGANPTNFTGVAMAVEGVAFGPSAITGALSLVARDGAQNASAVTQLNGGAALSLLSSTTLGGGEATLPSTFDLADGTFESTVGTTNATQFLRLKLAVPNVW